MHLNCQSCSCLNFILGYCFSSFKWIENVPCAERDVDLWLDIVKYVELTGKKRSADQPTCKACLVVRDAINVVLLVPRFHILISIAKQIKPIFTLHQTDQPMIPFMANDLKSMLKLLMKIFLKSDVLKNAESLYCFIKVDANKEDHLNYSQVAVGFAVEKQWTELLVSKRNQ